MKKLYILHLGIGNVGKSLVDQIQKFGGKELVYSGLFTSRNGVFNKEGFINKKLAPVLKFLSSRATEGSRGILSPQDAKLKRSDSAELTAEALGFARDDGRGVT